MAVLNSCMKSFAASLRNLYMSLRSNNLGDSHRHFSPDRGALVISCSAASPRLPFDFTITPCEHMCLELPTIIVHFKLCVPVSHLRSSESSLGPMAAIVWQKLLPMQATSTCCSNSNLCIE